MPFYRRIPLIFVATRIAIVLIGITAMAVQLTDILCDIGEDLAKGRIYLPEETLVQFGLTYGDIENRMYDERFKQMVLHLVQMARTLFVQGWLVMGYFPAAERLAAGFGAKVHWAALDKIEQVEYNVYSNPIKFSSACKLWLLISYLPAYFAMNDRPN